MLGDDVVEREEHGNNRCRVDDEAIACESEPALAQLRVVFGAGRLKIREQAQQGAYEREYDEEMPPLSGQQVFADKLCVQTIVFLFVN